MAMFGKFLLKLSLEEDLCVNLKNLYTTATALDLTFKTDQITCLYLLFKNM